MTLGGEYLQHRICKYNVWEWEDGQTRSEDWKPYSEKYNRLIIDSAARGKHELEINEASLNLMSMRETNASGFVRRIRGRTELSTFDTDGDGDVDGKELEGTMSTSGLGEGLDVEAQVALAKLILAKYDVDGSGDLSAEEMSAASTTIDAFLAHHGGGGRLTSTWWMRVAIACVAVTVGTLMWSWRQKRALLKDAAGKRDAYTRVTQQCAKVEAAKNAAQAAAAKLRAVAEEDAKERVELEAAKNAAQAARSRMSNYVAEMVLRVDAAESAAARALQAAQQVVANPQQHGEETNGKSAAGGATKSSTFGDDAAPRCLPRQTTACIAEDFDISLEEAHAALDGAGRNAAVARRAILERLRSGVGGGAVAWEFYDTRVGASPAESGAGLLERGVVRPPVAPILSTGKELTAPPRPRGSWRVFDVATSAKLTDALLEQVRSSFLLLASLSILLFAILLFV
jgi:Ca2+-binding EF-hand superfamily protein